MSFFEFVLLLFVVLFVLGVPFLHGLFNRARGEEKWIKVSPDVAISHPLYGVRGWLILFLIGVILSPLISLGSALQTLATLNTDWDRLGVINPNFRNVIFAQVAVTVVSSVVITWQLLTKNTLFRITTTVLLFISYPSVLLVATIYPVFGLWNALLSGAPAWLIPSIVWAIYIQRSKRIRVTYEGRIKCTDITLSRHDQAEVKSPVGNTDSVGQHPWSLPAVDSASTSSKQIFSMEDAYGASASEDQSRSHTPSLNGDLTKTLPKVLTTQIDEVDMRAWESALVEYEGEKRDKGLYAKLFVANDGNESKVKVAYLRQRALQLTSNNGERTRQ